MKTQIMVFGEVKVAVICPERIIMKPDPWAVTHGASWLRVLPDTRDAEST